MNIAQIEESLKALICGLLDNQIDQGAFIYHLLLAYGHRKQSVTRLRSGERNMASKSNEPLHDIVIWKRHLYFKQVEGNALHAEIDQMRKEKLVTTNKIRFVIITNFDQLLAVDTKTSDSIDINLDELPKQFDFFLPWAGMEKAVYQGENPADVKAAEKMAKLFDLIKGDNFDESNRDDVEALHNLNVFLTRLLFCFFAEDTEIFSDNQFSLAIQSHTKEDGSDLPVYLNRLFSVLNTAEDDRGELPDYLANFPYVNGGLFADDIPSPVFSAKARRMLIECGSELDWSDINPDIFGSMIQAVVHPDQRGGMGMHYTSVTNIMKVIEPLFLNDLYEELEKVEGSATKLQKLQQRLGEVKIFDPACGSGNFLIIAYKELRKFEMEVLKRLQELELEKTGQISQPFSVIKLSHFYGIELDDFAHEVAILSLWLAEHQMNLEFKTEFGEALPSLPLRKSGKIICENSLRIEWERVCPTGSVEDEVYILGNPPYVGYSDRNNGQKEDMDNIFREVGKVKRLDYIGCWFKKGADYLRGRENQKLAFVTTNSLCQGEQVSLLWPYIFESGLDISFAHESFKWTNNARSNAGVTCVIIGLENANNNVKKIYDGKLVRDVGNINPYLAESESIIISQRRKPLSDLPEMALGSSGIDGGHLLLSKTERDEFIDSSPDSERYIKRFVGGGDLLDGAVRYCLWINDEDLSHALTIPKIKERIELCRLWRENGGRDAKKAADVPHRFFYRKYKAGKNSMVLPMTSSERRNYIPVSICNEGVVPSNGVFVVYSSDPVLLGILSSKMHMVWIHAVSGRLESRIRYAVNLTYNNFPVPNIDQAAANEISQLVMNVLSVRESYPEKSLSDLYDPDEMPVDLLMAHRELDRAVEQCYQSVAFVSDTERLSALFNMYVKMTGGQNA